MKTIYAIILAAGESVRMGTPKMLLQFGGCTIIEKVLDNTRNSSINDYIVVVGAFNREIISASGEKESRFSYNDRYKSGMLTSVQCGIMAIRGKCDGAMIILGDQPMTGTGVINKVADCYRNNRNGIIIPVYKGKRGHPVVIDKKYWNTIDKLDPDKGLKSLMEIFQEDILEADIDDQVILRDIDTPEDYNREINYKL